MNKNFGKHFASMYEGSLVGAGSVVFAVMGYVIANQHPEFAEGGERLVVTLNPRLLGMILGDGEKAVREAIEFLCNPDRDSHSKDEDGRRLVRLSEFDYWVVNGRYYRELGREERKKEQNREAQRRFRQRKVKPVSGVYKGREKRFEKADGDGDLKKADATAAEGLEGTTNEHNEQNGSGGAVQGSSGVSGAGEPGMEGEAEGALSGVTHPGAGEDGGKGDNQEGSGNGRIQAQEGKTELDRELERLRKMKEARERGTIPEI